LVFHTHSVAESISYSRLRTECCGASMVATPTNERKEDDGTGQVKILSQSFLNLIVQVVLLIFSSNVITYHDYMDKCKPDLYSGGKQVS
jgi:hypothetical protein